MSILGRTVPIKTVVVLALCMVVGALIPAMSKTPPREITLVARGMAFYLENDPDTPNPTIQLRPGETIRVVLRNEEPGMMHDFDIPALGGAGLSLLGWQESGQMTINVPDKPGTYEYICTPHRLMMRGFLRVVGG
jgi:plastocyanin